MDVPQDLLYTDQHEWVKLEGNVGTVGVTEFAQEQLGDLTYIEAPDVGRKLSKGEEALAVESVKAAASVYAPADGKVSAFNEKLEDDPGLVNSDPYGDGWIFKFEIDDTGQLDDLLKPDAYQALLAEEG